MNKKIVEKSKEIALALESTHRTGRCFHVSFAILRSRFVSIGVNNYDKAHPSKRFGKYHSYKQKGAKYFPSTHSEIALVDGLYRLGHENCSRFTLLNIRVDNNGRLNMSRPCPNCANVLAQLNFRRIFYTDEKGGIVRFDD